ncbi:DUF3556 domain-containing protein [Gordonia malaquae]|uniref:DUF3556 domain-containing protein n=1 Tax=Gordonia malaquae TaxID=410332 RepID=UPI003BF7AF55
MSPGQWSELGHFERVRVMSRVWAERGAETPTFILLFYVVKLLLYGLGAYFIITATPGIGGAADITSWWSEPIVYQKLIVFTCLFEILGLGSSTGPLCFKFTVPFVAPLHWARPGTLRQPPWPRIPGTAGDARTYLDVALYIAVVAVMCAILASPAQPSSSGSFALGTVDSRLVIAFVAAIVLIGLRDKVLFIAARPEIYVLPSAIFLFPIDQVIPGLQVALAAVWVGAGASKFTHHFPSVVTAMTSNAPFRPAFFKRALYRSFPDDLRAGRGAFILAHISTVIEILAPIILLTCTDRWVTAVALGALVILHLVILSHVPLAVPNEWNVFMIAAGFYLFWVNRSYAIFDIANPSLIAFLVCGFAVPVVLGSLRPDLVSFALAMRYYAGNWPASLWCFKGDAISRMSPNLTKAAPMVHEQIAKLYDKQYSTLLNYKFRAWRSLHPEGRILNGLLPRALDNVDDYEVVDGELIASALNGWNMGDGHMHNEQLLRAVQRRCAFEPGELVVVLIESQPVHRAAHRYRLVDANLGEIERGAVQVSDVVDRQPWHSDNLPVAIESSTAHTGN